MASIAPAALFASLIHAPALSASFRRLVSLDSEWFMSHPNRLVRFRPIRAVELRQMCVLNDDLPRFVPPQIRDDNSPSWMAVANLIRIMDLPETSVLFCRFSTVPIRTSRLQALYEPLFVERIAADLLQHFRDESNSFPSLNLHAQWSHAAA